MSNETTNKLLSSSDEELFAAIAAGDAAALEAIYDRHAPLLFGLACKITQNRSVAEDVIQDVFVSLWKGAGRYNPQRGTAIAYLAILCRNRSIDALRAGGLMRKHTVGAAEETLQRMVDEARPTPLRDVELTQQAEAIKAAMGSLPDEQREMIELAYFGGLSQSEIAKERGIPLGTVKTRMRMAMQKLRVELAHLFQR